MWKYLLIDIYVLRITNLNEVLFGSFEVRREPTLPWEIAEISLRPFPPVENIFELFFAFALSSCLCELYILSNSYRNHIHFFVTSLRIQGNDIQ